MSVICLTLVPSALITKMSPLSPLVSEMVILEKAILFPLGEKAGKTLMALTHNLQAGGLRSHPGGGQSHRVRAPARAEGRVSPHRIHHPSSVCAPPEELEPLDQQEWTTWPL